MSEQSSDGLRWREDEEALEELADVIVSDDEDDLSGRRGQIEPDARA